MSGLPRVTLNTGTAMPQLGLGVGHLTDAQAAVAVSTALECGYRGIDTAAVYANERGTGRALAASGLPRADLFVTTKLWNADQGHDRTLRAFDASLAALGLEYVDLYLIHWPQPARELYPESWRALERIHAEGRARAIGVSNFCIPHLERLAAGSGIVPAVNQIELHPWYQRPALRAHHRARGIATEAYSPLGQGEVLALPVLTAIAGRYGVTAAQVVLRWNLQLGHIAIPRSADPARIRRNTDLLGFTLDDADLAAIADLDAGHRLGPDLNGVG
ncbi:aldo/keto reductase [Streptomyces sp. RKAG337]|uniref:aldo/keto reductase n=1 Tax=Streptomyces sp. RKAG337 TaxID=2893404 RepID=UPI002034331B|nr:aldo/keto reductase [Streptomyces sp. RKAG337]MCM2425611.1 aldo/keto reductase [Streptomyces sp. RKAG337]